jgi:hypothetical protein
MGPGRPQIGSAACGSPNEDVRIGRARRALDSYRFGLPIWASSQFANGLVHLKAMAAQAFTTTGMGRLTLNLLLFFAQFEREVTGERIRGKIAASEKKGTWMGGACRSTTGQRHVHCTSWRSMPRSSVRSSPAT